MMFHVNSKENCYIKRLKFLTCTRIPRLNTCRNSKSAFSLKTLWLNANFSPNPR